MYEVKMIDYDELPEYWKDLVPDNGSGKDCAGYIVIIHNGEIQSVESDAMEPEDAVFYRDLSWITFELQRAYELGLNDGKETQND